MHKMNIEEIREYCLSLPLATEDMCFGDDYLLFKVLGKIYACIGLTRPDYFVLKCDVGYATELRDRHTEIEPAWHWNKRYWNQLSLRGNLSPEFIRSLIRHSYTEVVRKMTKKTLGAHPELLSVDQPSTGDF